MDTINTINNTVQITLFILIVLLIVCGIFIIVASWRRKSRERKDQFKLTFLQIKLPPDNEIEIKAAEHMFSNLVGFRKSFFKALFTGEYRISFEIVGKQEGICFYVVIPNEIASIVEKQINASYPTAEIDIINPHEVWDRGKFTKVTELKLKGPNYYPIKVYEDLKNDSLNSITSTMSKLSKNEVLALQYIIQPAKDSWRLKGRNFISSIKQRQANPEKFTNVDEKFLEGVEDKIGNSGFYTKIKIISIAEDKFSAESQIQNMMSAFEQFTHSNYNRFVQRSLMSTKKLINGFIYRKINAKNITIPILGTKIYSNVSVLNTVELATIFHFPNKEVETPNITWLGAKKSSAPTDLPDQGIYVGTSLFRGVNKEVYIKEKDRTRHFYILGQTGTGKSELMKYMALQDIGNGEGVAFIDPHGTDIDDILLKIPPERKDDVILFDAADTERPLGVNMLEANSEEEKHLLINSFIATLYKLYDPNRQGIMGPLLERAIRNVMLTAMVDPESTMIDVLRLFIDEGYSKKFMDKIDDPLVKRYWTDEVAKTSASRKGETMGYFASKFDRFLTDKTMRNIIGQSKTSFDIDGIMAQKKILLIDLAKGKLGEENSSFIGLLIIPRILSAAFRRHKLKTEFPDFYLYVDEFQNFATDDFATILSEARKYKLNLVVGHQFIDQLSEEIRDAVFGNVGTTCVFRVGAEDAEYLETQFEPHFTKQDLLKLPVGNAYLKLLVDGQPTPPFSINIDWDRINSIGKNPEISDYIKRHCRQKYGVSAEEINKKIEKRITEQNSAPNLSRIPF